MIRPNTVNLILTYNLNEDFFRFTYEDGQPAPEFEGTSNIILENVKMDADGTISGTYNKPPDLIFYDDEVDKQIYPNYVDWFLFSKDREQHLVLDEPEKCRLEWITKDGEFTPQFKNKTLYFSKAYFRVCCGWGWENSELSALIYEEDKE